MTDYDDLCNGAGEWKNIQPVVRSALFGQAQDMIALKSHLVEQAKFQQKSDAIQKELLAKISQPNEQLQKQLTQLADNYSRLQKSLEKRVDEVEEKVLDAQHEIKLKNDKLQARLQSLEEQISKQLQQVDKNDSNVKLQLQQYNGDIKQLKIDVLDLNKIKLNFKDLETLKIEAVTQKDLVAQLGQLKSSCDNAIGQVQAKEKQNFDILQTQYNQQVENSVRQFEQIIAGATAKIPSVKDIQQISAQVFDQNVAKYVSKASFEQVALQLQQKISDQSTLFQQKLNSLVQDNQQQNMETANQLHQVLQKQAEQNSLIQQQLNDLPQLQQLKKQVQQVQIDMQSNSASVPKNFVTLGMLDDAISDQQKSQQKYIKAEIEGFVDNQLYRTVKSIIKAELDIQQTHQRHLIDDQISTLQQTLTRNITKQISPAEQMQKINENCDDLRQLIEMLGNDVDFKLQKQNEVQKQTLDAEISSVRHAIDSLNNVVTNSQDLLSIRLKEQDCGQQLLSQQCQALWVWKSKKLSQSNAIIWSGEPRNTMQSNYIWEKSKSSILIVSPGCYQFKFGIFARKRPTVQILVNGEPIISAMSGGVQPALYTIPKLAASQCWFSQGLQDWLYVGGNSVVQLVLGSEFASCLSGFLEIEKVW